MPTTCNGLVAAAFVVVVVVTYWKESKSTVVAHNAITIPAPDNSWARRTATNKSIGRRKRAWVWTASWPGERVCAYCKRYARSRQGVKVSARARARVSSIFARPILSTFEYGLLSRPMNTNVVEITLHRARVYHNTCCTRSSRRDIGFSRFKQHYIAPSAAKVVARALARPTYSNARRPCL